MLIDAACPNFKAVNGFIVCEKSVRVWFDVPSRCLDCTEALRKGSLFYYDLKRSPTRHSVSCCMRCAVFTIMRRRNLSKGFL